MVWISQSSSFASNIKGIQSKRLYKRIFNSLNNRDMSSKSSLQYISHPIREVHEIAMAMIHSGRYRRDDLDIPKRFILL